MQDAAGLLRQARHAAGLTQTELASRLGVSQPEIARLEGRGANPRLTTLVQAVEATGSVLDISLRPAVTPPVDESMIAANLRLEPAERLRRFATAYRNVSAMARKARRPHGP
jgi:transcriptional regulator with XRE-family HTH domain